MASMTCPSCGTVLDEAMDECPVCRAPVDRASRPAVQRRVLPEPSLELPPARVRRSPSRSPERSRPQGAPGERSQPTPGAPSDPAGQTEDPANPSQAGGRGHRAWWIGLVAGAVVVGLLGLWVVRRDSGGPPLRIRLIAADDPGPGPFTEDASSTVDADVEAIRTVGADLLDTEPDDGDLTVRPLGADAAQPVYGSTETPPCNVDAIAASLEADPSARAAWADLMEVDPSEVRATLAALTPLVLAHDTAVTNTRYVDGKPSTFQAILEAGTAVLVDGSGTPRVKCSCGNPLLPPEVIGEVELEGERWDDFDQSSVVAIEAADDDTATIQAIEATTGDVAPVTLVADEPEPGERSIRDRDPVPDDCVVRYLSMYRTAEDLGTEGDDLAWAEPYDEVPGSGLGRASTRPGVTVLLRDADGHLERSDLGELAGILGTEPPFILCGEPSEGIYWIEQDPPSDLPDDDDPVTLDGLGAIEVGAAYGQAEVATGHPMQRAYPMLGDDESCVMGSFGDPAADGVTVLGGDGRVRRIDISAPSRIRTDAGIGIGSSESEVKAAYPGEIEVQPHEYDPDGHYLVYRPADTNDRMMIFETDGRSVTTFRVGDDEFTPYVEGCA